MYRFTAIERIQLEELKTYLDEHLHLDLHLSRLCKKAGMNKHKLNAGFRELCGLNVMAYVYQARMIKADHLLRNTEKTIKQIAGETGYHFPSNFLIAYKKFFGHTAGSIRKS